MDAFSFLMLVAGIVCFCFFLPILVEMVKEYIDDFNCSRDLRRKRKQERNRSKIDERTRALRENARLNIDAQKAMYDMLQEALRSQSEHDEDELPD